MGYTIYDFSGNVRDQAWLNDTFGNVVVADDARKQYSVSALRARTGDSAIVVRVMDESGNSLPGIRVVFYWPDAPQDPNAGWHKKGVVGETNIDGCVGFGMGSGAYYWPPNGGPHSVWIYGDGVSQAVGGLGMLGGTNHDHLNVEFIRGNVEPENRHKVTIGYVGEGEVIENPEQPDDGYISGTRVGLEAVADPGWKFVEWRWTGGNSILNPYYFVIDSDIYIIAVFELDTGPLPPDYEEEIRAIIANLDGMIAAHVDIENNLMNIKAVLLSLVDGG